MRKIKFRAWDDFNKEMYLYDNPITHTFWIDFHGHLFRPSGIREFVSLDDKGFFLMQSIGLKDSKGHEVFEGDILEIDSDGEKSIHKVVWGGKDYPAWDLYPFLDCESHWDYL